MARFIIMAAMLLLARSGWSQSDGKAEAIAQAKALAAANGDLAREAASAKLKTALRHLLEQPDGLSMDLDELPLSRVDAPDGSFRLITWNIPLTDGSHRYEGLLLARQRKLTTLYELRDQTTSITNPELAELGPERWLAYALVALLVALAALRPRLQRTAQPSVA